MHNSDGYILYMSAILYIVLYLRIIHIHLYTVHTDNVSVSYYYSTHLLCSFAELYKSYVSPNVAFGHRNHVGYLI